MWFIGVEVEQETSAPPPKKNPGSAPETQPQTSKARESTASLSLAEQWTITEIRLQLNSVLTYSLLTDVVLL